MADKYLILDSSGVAYREIEGTVQSRGAQDNGKILALGTDGKIDQSILPTGVGADTLVAPASETLAAGDWLNAWNDNGTIKFRKADASSGVGKRATHFTLAATTAGQNATGYPVGSGTNSALSGLVPASAYFLSNTTPGGVTPNLITTSGHLNQFLGFARSATALESRQGYVVVRA
jgi:hypothetical protein